VARPDPSLRDKRFARDNKQGWTDQELKESKRRAMIKKQTKSKATAKKRAAKKTPRKKSEARAKPETNPAEVRKEVSKLVEAKAKEMAGAVIGEATKGQLAPMKYLFEMASIYPPAPDGSQATEEEDCLAKMLLDRLDPPAKPTGEKDETSEVRAEDAAGAKAAEPQKAGETGEEAKPVAGEEIPVVGEA
jgi:hypothetical protein